MNTQTPATAESEKWLRVRFFTNFFSGSERNTQNPAAVASGTTDPWLSLPASAKSALPMDNTKQRAGGLKGRVYNQFTIQNMNFWPAGYAKVCRLDTQQDGPFNGRKGCFKHDLASLQKLIKL